MNAAQRPTERAIAWAQEELNVACGIVLQLYVNMSVMLMHASFNFNVTFSYIKNISIILIPLRFFTSVISRFPHTIWTKWWTKCLCSWLLHLGFSHRVVRGLSEGINLKSWNINIFEICQHGSSGAQWRRLFFTQRAICLMAGLDVLFRWRCVM